MLPVYIGCHSKDAYNLLFDTSNKNTIEHVEEFKILLMNRSNAVLGILPVSKGGISRTVTDVRIIFQSALKANASGIIVCHTRFSFHKRNFTDQIQKDCSTQTHFC
jgi:DNA repair protein RadC